MLELQDCSPCLHAHGIASDANWQLEIVSEIGKCFWVSLRGGGAGAERNLLNAFRGIGQICERLGLLKNIKDRACELYKKVGRGLGSAGLGAAPGF